MSKLLSRSERALGSEQATRAGENGSSLEQVQLVWCQSPVLRGLSLERGPFLRGDRAMEPAKKGFLEATSCSLCHSGSPRNLGSCFVLRLPELPGPHHPTPSGSEPRLNIMWEKGQVLSWVAGPEFPCSAALF